MPFARWTMLPVAVSLLAVSIVWGATPAAACSCIGAPFEAQDGHDGLTAFDAVFIGTATDNQRVSSDEVEWVFEVQSVLHGEVASPISLSTPIDGGACGLDWVDNGSTIAVGVSRWEGMLSTDLCSVDREEAVDGVGERRPPLEPGDPLAINADDTGQAQGGIGPVDDEPTESRTSQIILIAIGMISIVGAAAFTAVLARRSE